MERDSNGYRLSTGRLVYAHAGVIGVWPDLSAITYGYDGFVARDGEDEDTPDTDALTPAERVEIAEAMIARWTAFRDRWRTTATDAERLARIRRARDGVGGSQIGHLRLTLRRLAADLHYWQRNPDGWAECQDCRSLRPPDGWLPMAGCAEARADLGDSLTVPASTVLRTPAPFRVGPPRPAPPAWRVALAVRPLWDRIAAWWARRQAAWLASEAERISAIRAAEAAAAARRRAPESAAVTRALITGGLGVGTAGLPVD